MTHGLALDLFAGAGGASEGMEQAGYDVVAANEINQHAALTYKFNHPKTNLIVKDVKRLTVKELQITNKIDLFFAGLPCQGFSNAGKKDKNDNRNYLFHEVIRLAKEIKPRYVLIENVSGLLADRNRRFFTSIQSSLTKLGYHVSHRLFDVSDFGIPQKRKRVLILASTEKDTELSSFILKKYRKTSVKAAIDDLAFLTQGSADEYLKLPRTSYQRIVRGDQKRLLNHETAIHSRKVIRRFTLLKEGQVMKSALPRSHTKKIYAIKLNSLEPAPTITTMPDDYIHYGLSRTLTVREMARLQSFRDSYLFLGPRTTGGKIRRFSVPQYTQVGNAVPPMFMEPIAIWLLSK